MATQPAQDFKESLLGNDHLQEAATAERNVDIQDFDSKTITHTQIPESAADADVKVGKGNFLSSMFTVFNSAVGFGILTLPYSLRSSGLLFGSLTLLFYTVISCVAAAALVRCCHAAGASNYQDAVKHYLGRRAGHILALILSLYCFLACTGGFIIAADVSQPTISKLVSSGFLHDNRRLTRCLAVVVAAFCAAPFMYLRDITSLRFTAMLSLASVLYVVAFVMAEGAKSFSNVTFTPKGDGSMKTALDLLVVDWKLLYAIPNIALSLQCHIQVPTIYAELRPDLKSPKFFDKPLAVAFSAIFLLYLPIAIFGFVQFGAGTPPNIMEAPFDHGSKPSASLVVGRACLLVVAICSLPINHNPARSALYEVWRAARAANGPAAASAAGATIPRNFFMAETTAFFVLAVGMGMVVPDLSTLNDIMGATAGVSVIFILPGAMVLASTSDRKVEPEWGRVPTGRGLDYKDGKPGRGRWLGAAFVVVGVVTGLICAFAFVYSKVMQKDWPQLANAAQLHAWV